MNAHDNAAAQALSDAGAQCGVCGDEPGDRTCPECEQCYEEYVTALRAAGWAPRAEVLREAADAAPINVHSSAAEGVRRWLRRMADQVTAP